MYLLAFVSCGLGASAVFLCSECPIEIPRGKHPPDSTPKDVDGSAKTVLAPLLPDLGLPALFYRETWSHVEWAEMGHPVGQPFGVTAFSLEVAIWPDGTVIWGDDREFYEARISAEAVDELLSIVPLRELESPQAKQYLERIVFDRYCPVSVIGIRGKAGLFLLYSNLDQMEKTKKYWFWDDRTRREFPFPLYSFEQFCAEVPDWYAEYERAFDHLRWEVKAAIPAKGSRIALGDRIRCMNVRGQLGELLDNSGSTKR